MNPAAQEWALKALLFLGLAFLAGQLLNGV
jgi:hypothetical protein